MHKHISTFSSAHKMLRNIYNFLRQKFCRDSAKSILCCASSLERFVCVHTTMAWMCQQCIQTQLNATVFLPISNWKCICCPCIRISVQPAGKPLSKYFSLERARANFLTLLLFLFSCNKSSINHSSITFIVLQNGERVREAKTVRQMHSYLHLPIRHSLSPVFSILCRRICKYLSELRNSIRCIEARNNDE